MNKYSFEEEKNYAKRLLKVLLKWVALSAAIFSLLCMIACFATALIIPALFFLVVTIFLFYSFYSLRWYKLKAIIKVKKENKNNVQVDLRTSMITNTSIPATNTNQNVLTNTELQSPIAAAPVTSTNQNMMSNTKIEAAKEEIPSLKNTVKSYGIVKTTKVDINAFTNTMIKNRFIAFDLETTGLDSESERIIEIGATLFVNGKPTDVFQSLVNPNRKIPFSATRVNHITDAMVADAPRESEALRAFSEFAGDAFSEGIVFCAHNADFDVKFLKKALQRSGIDASILYIDTLSLSRRRLKGLPNYKLQTVADYFLLSIENAHRAGDDATICGEILCKILSIEEADEKSIQKTNQEIHYSEFEQSLLETTREILKNNNLDFQNISLFKNSTYTDVCYKNYTMLRFKTTGQLRYWLIDMEVERFSRNYQTNLKYTPASKSENNKTRLFIKDAKELFDFENLVLYNLNRCRKWSNAR